MILLPAIDLFDGKAVRLFRGDYAQMTVYNENPAAVAASFAEAGATWMHLVDLQGAKSGKAEHLQTVRAIVEQTPLSVEIGGGIRSAEVVEQYLSLGVQRVILGTAALQDPAFLNAMVQKHGEHIAVGVDLRDGKVAVKGWTETSDKDGIEFCKELEHIGVQTIICTDISKDGAMAGTNVELYEQISKECGVNLVASGGVSSLTDVRRLAERDIYGAILGKALYTGAIDLAEALQLAGGAAK